MAGAIALAIISSIPSLAAAQNEPGSFPVRVRVTQGDQGAALAGVPVFLRAARVKGPFEPTDPKPEREWSAVSDDTGTATFSNIPPSIAERGLRLHAAASYDGMVFKSAASPSAPGLVLSVPAYKRGFDHSKIRVSSVRMIIEPWEKFLVYTQMWSITLDGQEALDTSLIPDERFERGIPIELPLKAKGINVTGGSQTKVVNSTVYLKDVLIPGQPINLQLRYSITANDATITYDQPLDYPVDNLEVIVPLETPYKNKLPRLNDVGIRAPGFKADDIIVGTGIPGLREDKEFLFAKRSGVTPDDSIKFQLFNLPYKRPLGPWIALGIGVAGGLLILLVALTRREERSEEDEDELIAALKRERNLYLDELAALEEDVDQGRISEQEFEYESLRLRSRAGLIMKKLDELQGTTRES